MFQAIFSEICVRLGDTGNIRLHALKNGASIYFFNKKAVEIRTSKIGTYIRVASDDGEKKTGDARPFRRFDLILDTIPQEAWPCMQAAYDHCKSIEVVESFGCCNDFLRCSDNRSCIHKDDPFYRGCYYRKNLEAGRIFYGKNRNID